MTRRLVGAVVVVAAVSAVAGGVAGAGGGTKKERKASVFVAPAGSDDASCRKRAKACASFNRAYQAARPGEVVEVAARHVCRTSRSSPTAASARAATS